MCDLNGALSIAEPETATGLTSLPSRRYDDELQKTLLFFIGDNQREMKSRITFNHSTELTIYPAKSHMA